MVHATQCGEVETCGDEHAVSESFNFCVVPSHPASLNKKQSPVTGSITSFARKWSLGAAVFSLPKDCVIRKWTIKLDDTIREVSLRHQNAVWTLLLDSQEIRSMSHRDNLSASNFVMSFAMPADDGKMAQAVVNLDWVRKKSRWRYALHVNGIFIPASYTWGARHEVSTPVIDVCASFDTDEEIVELHRIQEHGWPVTAGSSNERGESMEAEAGEAAPEPVTFVTKCQTREDGMCEAEQHADGYNITSNVVLPGFGRPGHI
jgi:hypothetical protein